MGVCACAWGAGVFNTLPDFRRLWYTPRECRVYRILQNYCKLAGLKRLTSALLHSLLQRSWISCAAWQSRRLGATYADYLVQPRYRAACLFFLNDVYSAKDFRKRDNEIKHLYEILHHFLPDALLVLVKTVIELDGLTTTLDEALWEVLEEELGVEDKLPLSCMPRLTASVTITTSVPTRSS